MISYDTTTAVQRALIAQGVSVGKAGADGIWGGDSADGMKAFQRKAGLPVTGVCDPASIKALGLLALAPATLDVGAIPADWMPDAKMIGIVVHWTAGTHKATEFDREHYHFLQEDDGKLIRGIPSVDKNSLPRVKVGYAAHTLANNTGWVGFSNCCMGGDGVTETPFRTGNYPLTETQWSRLPGYLAQICRRYGIKVSRETLLSHAEVQLTLKKPQKGKWDISRLSFDPGFHAEETNPLKRALLVGDVVRQRTAAILATL